MPTLERTPATEAEADPCSCELHYGFVRVTPDTILTLMCCLDSWVDDPMSFGVHYTIRGILIELPDGLEAHQGEWIVYNYATKSFSVCRTDPALYFTFRGSPTPYVERRFNDIVEYYKYDNDCPVHENGSTVY